MVAPRASRFLPQARRIVGPGDENDFGETKFNAVDTAIITFSQCLPYSNFFFLELSVLMVLACYYKGMFENGNDAKNPAIVGFFYLIESQI